MPVPDFINALHSPTAYPHPVTEVRLIETHISWVLLAGEYAYKIKKPVNLGFLDFSTLDQRRFCCEEELRLNRRLEPDTYLEVVAITGDGTTAVIQGKGPVLEWAVRMRAFPADATLDREPEITPDQIDVIADRIARFHKTIDPSPADSDFGTPESVMHPVRENFAQLHELLKEADPDTLRRIDELERWSEAEGIHLESHFRVRKSTDHVRECHGDLHLGNIAWADGRPIIFDCIEFNPSLRHIDIVSEAAFLFMDLTERGHPGLAWRFLNRWLEHTGDFAGLAGFRFYLVYRAMVRAKVAGIRSAQNAKPDLTELQHYLDQARTFCRKPDPSLILMHGHSGSGKTWLSQRMLEARGAVRLRSDVERKRLFGLDALEDSANIAGGIYGPEANQHTLNHLLIDAESLLQAGFTVIVDATFIARSWRQPFFDSARKHGWPIHIVAMNVAAEEMRRRIQARARLSNDASEAGLEVLEAQLANAEPLDENELKVTRAYSPDEPEAWPLLLEWLNSF